MPKTLPISEVKARLPELVTGVEDREEEIEDRKMGHSTLFGVNEGRPEKTGAGPG